MLTLDANIWVAAYDPRDPFHEKSVAFLYAVTQQRLRLHAPAFMIVEATCALSRRAQNSTAGQAVLQQLRAQPLLVLHPLDELLLATATQLGIQQLLRGADALYAATAAMLNAPLISWDTELVHRAGAITPADWLAAHPADG
jgi:predicted nucleic acid-binding protein